MRGSIGAHLIREAGSGAKEHVAAHGSTSCSLSSPHSCMRGYPVYRVLTRGVMNGDGSHPSLGGHAGRSGWRIVPLLVPFIGWRASEKGIWKGCV
jgi:hypothetical protein